MAISAIILILISGFLHSIWNYFAKRSRHKLCFIWLIKFCSLFLLLPLIVLWYHFHPEISSSSFNLVPFLAAVITSSLIHAFYNYFLAKAYIHGEISLAYPVSRGSAPFLVAFFSFFFIGEKLSALGVTGMILTALGVFGVSFRRLNTITRHSNKSTQKNSPNKESKIRKSTWPTFAFAGLTALMISLYTLIDGMAARKFGVIIFMYSYSVVSTAMLAIPIMRSNTKALKDEIISNYLRILAAGILMPASYILALYAMRIANLGYVATMRNISIVFATLIGIVKLEESYGKTKIISSLILFAGILAMGFS